MHSWRQTRQPLRQDLMTQSLPSLQSLHSTVSTVYTWRIFKSTFEHFLLLLNLSLLCSDWARYKIMHFVDGPLSDGPTFRQEEFRSFMQPSFFHPNLLPAGSETLICLAILTAKRLAHCCAIFRHLGIDKSGWAFSHQKDTGLLNLKVLHGNMPPFDFLWPTLKI